MEESNTAEETLSNLRRRNKRVTLFFTLIFVALTLIIALLIVYLVSDINSESNHLISERQYEWSPETDPPDKSLTLALQRAAEQLENITASSDPPSLKNCSGPLRGGLTLVHSVLQTMGRRVSGETVERIAMAEQDLRDCLEGLEESATTMRAKVAEACDSISSAGNFVRIVAMQEDLERKDWTRDLAELIVRNLFLICVGGLQFSFVGFLFWIVYRFR